jgi:hypothetical protein
MPGNDKGDFRVVNMEFQYGSACCGCEEVDAPRFIRAYRNKAGEIVNHSVCRCKCHGEIGKR